METHYLNGKKRRNVQLQDWQRAGGRRVCDDGAIVLCGIDVRERRVAGDGARRQSGLHRPHVKRNSAFRVGIEPGWVLPHYAAS